MLIPEKPAPTTMASNSATLSPVLIPFICTAVGISFAIAFVFVPVCAE